MLFVTHELGLARQVAGTTVFMHQGMIHGHGPSRTPFKNPVTPGMA